MQNGLTTKQAIEQVMRGKRRPMQVREVIDAAVPLSRLAGKTPGQEPYVGHRSRRGVRANPD